MLPIKIWDLQFYSKFRTRLLLDLVQIMEILESIANSVAN